MFDYYKNQGSVLKGNRAMKIRINLNPLINIPRDMKQLKNADK